MAIDIASESVISLAEASTLLPGRPSITSLWRWHARGVKGIRLETVLVGGKRFTSREAVQRFADALTGGTAQPLKARTPNQVEGGTVRPLKARTSKQHQRQIERAEAEIANDSI